MKHETTTSKGKPADTPVLGHESGDLDLAWTIPWVVGLFVVILIVVFGMRYVYNYKLVREGGRAKFMQESPFKLEPEVQGMQPLLQVDEVGEMNDFRTQEDALLSNYGWVNKDTKTVRIPIEQAMSIVLQKGLPARAGAQ